MIYILWYICVIYHIFKNGGNLMYCVASTILGQLREQESTWIIMRKRTWVVFAYLFSFLETWFHVPHTDWPWVHSVAGDALRLPILSPLSPEFWLGLYDYTIMPSSHCSEITGIWYDLSTGDRRTQWTATYFQDRLLRRKTRHLHSA